MCVVFIPLFEADLGKAHEEAGIGRCRIAADQLMERRLGGFIVLRVQCRGRLVMESCELPPCVFVDAVGGVDPVIVRLGAEAGLGVGEASQGESDRYGDNDAKLEVGHLFVRVCGWTIMHDIASGANMSAGIGFRVRSAGYREWRRLDA